MATTLYKDDNHLCLAFRDLVKGDGVQANQFLVIHQRQAALLDPGGALTYHSLLTSILKYLTMDDLRYVVASHQDPDVIASLGMWIKFSHAKIVSSALWSRFLPHLTSEKIQEGKRETDLSERFISIPDVGMDLALGDSIIKCVPAHFLHSVGNFQFYDPVSKILFSGDMGASLIEKNLDDPVEDFKEHIQYMTAFHKRYMVSNKICRLWAGMIRMLDVEMIVPQHGRSFQGKEMIGNFLNWIERLECGTDLLTERNYQIK